MKFNSETGRNAGKKSTRKGIKDNFSKKRIEKIEEILQELDRDIKSDIKSLPKQQRTRFWLDLQEYVVPKLARSEQIIEMGKDFRDVIYDKKDASTE